MIVNNNVIEYINSLEGEMPKHLYELEKTALQDKVPIIKKETQGFIRFLLSFTKPKKHSRNWYSHWIFSNIYE